MCHRTARAAALTLLAAAAMMSCAGSVEQMCKEPLVVGHRGTRFYAPENTLPAFKWAMEHGADGIEFDVQTTKDGVLVAMHDNSTGRTTNDGADRLVSDLTFAEVRALDAGAWFGDAFAGTRVPTIEEIVTTVDPRARLVFDRMTVDNVDAVAALIERHHLQDRAAVSSFSADALAAAARRMPDVPRILFLSGVRDVKELRSRILAVRDTVKPTSVRVPKELQDDPTALQLVTDLGYTPSVSGRSLGWFGGYVFANNPDASARRKRERKPAHCP